MNFLRDPKRTGLRTDTSWWSCMMRTARCDLLTWLQSPVLCSSSFSCCGVRLHPNPGRWLERAGCSALTRPLHLLRPPPVSSLNVCRQNELKVNLSCCSVSETDPLSSPTLPGLVLRSSAFTPPLVHVLLLCPRPLHSVSFAGRLQCSFVHLSLHTDV